MKIAIVDENYPSENNLYGDVFAHVRIKAYQSLFDQILVFSSLKCTKKKEYEYQGIQVVCSDTAEEMHNQIINYGPDIILVHFATYPLISGIINRIDLPYVIWVHGYEALGWYRRLFNMKNPLGFRFYIRDNTIQLYHFRKLIKKANRDKKIHFVFVSNWMKRVTEFDCAIRVKNAHIIPNPVDDKLFHSTRKDVALRKKILLIRPFYSKKYATDIVTEAMVELQKTEVFNELSFTVYGKDSSKSRMHKLFSSCKNVSINEGFLTQEAIKQLHDDHGIFMALTRQDAQGVSMCEAMSSGLVVITSNNTAIPEFVTHRKSGFVTNNNPKEIANAIQELYDNPSLFSAISEGGSKAIIEKAGLQKVIAKEIQVIKSLIPQ